SRRKRRSNLTNLHRKTTPNRKRKKIRRNHPTKRKRIKLESQIKLQTIRQGMMSKPPPKVTRKGPSKHSKSWELQPYPGAEFLPLLSRVSNNREGSKSRHL